MKSKIILSIGLLASNRKDTIQKSIASLNSLREKVPCELIVTDTGCDADLRTFLQENADKVNDFVWCDNFAAARNSNLALANGEWYLYLDDDEWFENTAEIEEFFTSGEYLKYDGANYIQRNYKRYDGSVYNDCWVSRMIRLSNDVRFTGKIHEYLIPESTNCKLLHAYVHHYGYIYQSEEALRRHFTRNTTLLKQMIEEEPEVFRWRTHLAKEYAGVKDWEALEALGLDGIALADRVSGTESDIMRGTFYMCRIQSAYELEQYEKGNAICETALQDTHNTKMCMASVMWWQAKINMQIFEFSTALNCIKGYLELETELKGDVANLAIQMTAPMVCLCLDEDYHREALAIKQEAEGQERKLLEVEQIKKGAKNRKPLLSITLLVSNRKDTTQKCLDSLTSLRKEIPCELIVTDTGCDAALRGLVDRYADSVNEFTWCNDFSAARNQGLSLSRGEWYMFLDDDEWFIDTKEIVDFFKKGYYKQFDHAYYIQRNFSDWEGNSYSDSYVLRILKRTEDMHFEGKIHEYLLPEKKKGLALKTAVCHYGYIYKTDEDARKHYERNRYLLEDMVKAEPYTLRWRTHLAKEYIFGKNYEELYALGIDGIRVLDKPELIKETSNHDIQLGTFYAAQLVALMAWEKYDQAQEVCQKALADSRNTQLCRAYMYYQYAELCFGAGKYEESIGHLQKYLEIYGKLTQNEASLIAQRTAAIIGTAFEPKLLRRVHYLLVIAAVKTGKDQIAERYLPELDLAEGRLDECTAALIQALIKKEDGAGTTTVSPELIGKIIARIHPNDEQWTYFCRQIDQRGNGSNTFKVALNESGFYPEMEAYIKWTKAECALTQEQLPRNFEEAWKRFLNYYEACAQYMGARKGKHYMDDNIEVLTTDCIAALLIREAAQYNGKNTQKFCEALGQCASIYAPFAAPVRHLLHLKEHENASSEMENLKQKILEDVNEKIKMHQYPDAIGILNQLKQTMPGDLQIASLSLEARLLLIG